MFSPYHNEARVKVTDSQILAETRRTAKLFGAVAVALGVLATLLPSEPHLLWWPAVWACGLSFGAAFIQGMWAVMLGKRRDT